MLYNIHINTYIHDNNRDKCCPIKGKRQKSRTTMKALMSDQRINSRCRSTYSHRIHRQPLSPPENEKKNTYTYK